MEKNYYHQNKRIMLSTSIMRSSETLLTPRPTTKTVSKLRPISHTDTRSSDRASGEITKKQLIRWTIILGLSFTFVCSSFAALQNLLSSLFVETGIGMKSLACVFAVASISSLYSQFFVDRLTPNWVIVTSFVMTALYITVYFYPRTYTVIAAAALLGFSLGPLRCAHSTYLVQITCKLSSLTSSEVHRESILRENFCRFAVFLNSGQIWGNLLTSLLFHYGDDIYVYPIKSKTSLTTDLSLSINMSPFLSRKLVSPTLCDSDQCKRWNIFRSNTPFAFIVPSNVSLMLVSVCLGLTFVGVALATVLLDKFDFREDGDKSLTKTVKSYFLSYVDPHFRLICPLILFSGLQQGFIIADFTKSYISCSLGLEAIGYALMTMGLTQTLGSLMIYRVPKYISRFIIMLMGLSLHGGLITVLSLWRPIKDDFVIFHIITAFWGVCNAIWETLTTTFIIKVFINDFQSQLLSHFSIHCIGLSIAFASSFYLCTEIKLYFLAILLVIAIVPYGLAEFRYHQQNKSQERTTVL